MMHPIFNNLETGDDHCFLCGSSSGPITEEHVFPKWLQERHNLWDQRITLLNGTRIQYRNLRIPCCSTCNNDYLSRLETTISSAVNAGYKGCGSVDERVLYLWAGKLFYGILRKEITLLLDRSDPVKGNIIPEAMLKSFSNLHMFLQGIRGKHSFSAEMPYSVMVCNLHDLGYPRNYSFRDSIGCMTFSIRLGEIGIIVALEDGRLSANSYGRYIEEVNGRKLHPIQFDELYARVLYQVSLMEGAVNYLTFKKDESGQPAQTEVVNGGYLREWSHEDFSKVLRAHVSGWLNPKSRDLKWFTAPDIVPTWLTNESGDIFVQPLSGWEQGHA